MTVEKSKAFDSNESDNGIGTYVNVTEVKRPNAFVRFLKWLEIETGEGMTTSQLFLYNYDLRPVEKERRLWSWFNFVFFWIADSFNVNTWQIAATGVQAGLSWWVVWITVWIGYGITGVFVTLAARSGAYYHTSFPVTCRSSFGVFGSIWPVINRVVMAIIWYGVQSWIGGECVQLMLKAIFGNDLDTRINNTIGSSGTTSFQFLSFFLFWLFSLPAIWFPPHQIRHLFTIKAYIVPVAGIAFLVWTIVRAGGVGPVVHQKSKISGSEFGWAFVNSTMNCLANFATLIVNAPDFSRFANTKRAPIMSQMLAIPICFSITSLIGILVSSASTVMYGETYWSPLDVLSQFLSSFTRGDRAGVFLISFAFSIAQLGTNISANSLSAGTDMTALLAKYINIRRGGFICAVIALAMCPWKLLSSSNKFTTYLSAYSVFLSSIAGVVFADYYIVRRGFMVLEDLYTAKRTGAYTYNRFGVNFRAYGAYICGIAPNIVGFVGATGTHVVPAGATYVYDLNFFAGYISAASVYTALCMLFPVEGRPMKKWTGPGWFEEWQEVEDFADRIHHTKLVEPEYAVKEGSSI